MSRPGARSASRFGRPRALGRLARPFSAFSSFSTSFGSAFFRSPTRPTSYPTNPRPGRSKERFQAMDEITVGTVGVVALFAAILGGVNVMIALGAVGMLGLVALAGLAPATSVLS